MEERSAEGLKGASLCGKMCAMQRAVAGSLNREEASMAISRAVLKSAMQWGSWEGARHKVVCSGSCRCLHQVVDLSAAQVKGSAEVEEHLKGGRQLLLAAGRLAQPCHCGAHRR